VSNTHDDRNTELREFFFETAQELLQSLNDEALKLESNPGDLETVRTIRRVAHTLKGDAAACGFRELSETAHEFEDALALESAAANKSLAEITFKSADIFTAMLAAYRGRTKLPSTAALLKMIGELTQEPQSAKAQKGGKGAKSKAAAAEKKSKSAVPSVLTKTDWTEYEKLAMQKSAGTGKSVFHLIAQVDMNCAMPIAARQLVLNAVGSIGQVLGVRPEDKSSTPTKRLEVLLATQHSKEDIIAKCLIPTVISTVEIELAMAPQQPSEAAAIAENAEEIERAVPEAHSEGEAHNAQRSTASPDNILRVDAERIDSVLNLVGELIIGKSMLQQAQNEFARRFTKDPLRGRFSDAMAFQARVLNDLQRSVMKIRMVPVEQLFRRFPRMVRDVAKQCGKDVTLAMSGIDTDLDKSLLDAITEPLTHLVRNSVSHGIEGAEDRARAGKPAQGKIHLRAYHQGNQVVIEASDDGRGINADKVKARAVEKGLITNEQASRLSEPEIHALIFKPGFSTADQITEVSGRGVGLDVVQSVLHRLKGTVEIESRPGQGATFRLKLPLTLAIIKALLFRVEQRLYAIPLNAVAEITRARESDLHTVDYYEVLQLRDQVLPLLRLGHRSNQPAHSGKIFVLVIAMGDRKLGLIVDALEGEEELVIKALDDHTVSTDLVSGASILGDGRVVLILNLAALVDRFSKMRPTESGSTISGILLSYADRARLLTTKAEVRA
jgi:two-component system, chemotaxis family, sensor kinase CheA